MMGPRDGDVVTVEAGSYVRADPDGTEVIVDLDAELSEITTPGYRLVKGSDGLWRYYTR